MFRSHRSEHDSQHSGAFYAVSGDPKQLACLIKTASHSLSGKRRLRWGEQEEGTSLPQLQWAAPSDSGASVSDDRASSAGSRPERPPQQMPAQGRPQKQQQQQQQQRRESASRVPCPWPRRVNRRAP